MRGDPAHLYALMDPRLGESARSDVYQFFHKLEQNHGWRNRDAEYERLQKARHAAKRYVDAKLKELRERSQKPAQLSKQQREILRPEEIEAVDRLFDQRVAAHLSQTRSSIEQLPDYLFSASSDRESAEGAAIAEMLGE